MEEQAQETKLDFKTKFFYGFGSISFGIKKCAKATCTCA